MESRQVIISLDDAEEVRNWKIWLEANEATVALSDNDGCGCCVDIYEVKGSKEVLETLPAQFVGYVRKTDHSRKIDRNEGAHNSKI